MDPLRTINPTIDVYIDLARELNGLSSDRRVAQALGVTPATVNAWRSKRQWPSDQAMIRLADLTQRARECALVDLNMWRARTPAVRQTYGKILGRLTGAILVLAILGPGAGNATSTDQPVNVQGYTLCAKQRRRRTAISQIFEWLGLPSQLCLPAG